MSLVNKLLIERQALIDSDLEELPLLDNIPDYIQDTQDYEDMFERERQTWLNNSKTDFCPIEARRQAKIVADRRWLLRHNTKTVRENIKRAQRRALLKQIDTRIAELEAPPWKRLKCRDHEDDLGWYPEHTDDAEDWWGMAQELIDSNPNLLGTNVEEYATISFRAWYPPNTQHIVMVSRLSKGRRCGVYYGGKGSVDDIRDHMLWALSNPNVTWKVFQEMNIPNAKMILVFQCIGCQPIQQ